MTPVLRAEGVYFSFRRREVLTDVTLAACSSEIIAIVGPNGAGKTTLLKLLAGLLAPSAGRVQVSGSRARTVAYLAQSEELPSDWSVREVVELGRLPHVGFFRHLTGKDEHAISEAMDRTNVGSLAERLVGTLSGGERQRVALARALAQQPRMLLLDEPTTHLDLRYQASLLSLLRAEANRGVGVVAVMHDLTSAGRADRCVLLSEGRIRAEGPPSDVLRVDLLRQVYDTDVELLYGRDGRIVVTPTVSASARSETPAKENIKWTSIELS